MNRHCVRLALIVSAILVSMRPAVADPVRITSGYLDMSMTSGSLALAGEGFTLTAGVTVGEGVFQPWLQCRLSPTCVAGAGLDLGATWVGSGLRSARATVGGETFDDVGGPLSNSSAIVNFTGSAIAPPLIGDSATLIAPFLFQGQFVHFNASLERIVESLSGEGTVTLLLQRNPTLQTWSYAAAKYEFQAVPEPATVLLTAAGITTLLASQRRRRRTARPVA